ncbi:Hypothetical predicted protein [Cloeon dipterum]|uniref:DRBM domain-containing protein n=1 Tax=Cloeon dipterum TaxID=197152 RepID=A0A8S1CN74_9INSE|nr:Hypothetical predicted protein [Cloeon dipterum]
MKRTFESGSSSDGELESPAKCPFIHAEAPPPPPEEFVPPPPDEEELPPQPPEAEEGESRNGDTPMPAEFLSFDILDEYHYFNAEEQAERVSPDDDGDSNQMSFDETSEESDVPVDEIHNMLEEGVTAEKIKAKKAEMEKNDEDVVEKEKIVLNEKDHNHFDVLPEGWIKITHECGMPVYLHRKTRVCTMARPYALGTGSVRKHNIPLNAIPCLHYAKIQERETKPKEVKQADNDSNAPATGQADLPKVRVETVKENIESNTVTSTELQNYCKSRFEFKTIKVKRFNSWISRRRFSKMERAQKQLTRSTLPEGTNLITFPLYNPNENEEDRAGSVGPRKEWVMNPNGKSYVCILHEYVQHALRKQPEYEYKELENAATPYSATVIVNDVRYGQGFGTSKKQAKSEAAKETLEMMIPEIRKVMKQDSKGRYTSNDTDLNYFDSIDITDPRVPDLCAKTCELSPYGILLICLQRNIKLENMKIEYDVNTSKHQKNEYTMRVGEHTATVPCKNKRDGKQRASQEILKQLHPNVKSWGSLLRLYGTRSIKSLKEKKQEEKEITVLQKEASHNSPNYAILEKLRKEMMALHEKQVCYFIMSGGKYL